MKTEEIKQWRGCGLLDQFFSIKCASTTLNETTFGEVVDFLLAEIDHLRYMEKDVMRQYLDTQTQDAHKAEILKWQQRCELQARQMSEIKKYFTSGNAVPVERATILAKDFWQIIGQVPE